MRLNEIYPDLISCDFICNDIDDFFWRIWLWGTTEGLKNWNKIHDIRDMGPCQEGAHYGFLLEFDQPHQCIGDLHFIAQHWDEETVGHELIHAIIHYCRSMIPHVARIIYLGPMEEEEDKIAYPFGRMFNGVWRWLWKKDPNLKWQRAENE